MSHSMAQFFASRDRNPHFARFNKTTGLRLREIAWRGRLPTKRRPKSGGGKRKAGSSYVSGFHIGIEVDDPRLVAEVDRDTDLVAVSLA